MLFGLTTDRPGAWNTSDMTKHDFIQGQSYLQTPNPGFLCTLIPLEEDTMVEMAIPDSSERT
jgi:hypothetical protein